MSTDITPYMLTFTRFVTGFAFALSGSGKLRNLPAFERAITDFKILPEGLVKVAAPSLVIGELIVVLLLLFGGRFLLPGFLLAILLLLMFSIALLSVLARELQTPCNCFGSSAEPVSRFDVLRNLGFVGCALLGLGVLYNPAGEQANLNVVEFVLLGLMAITFSVMWIKISDFGELFRR